MGSKCTGGGWTVHTKINRMLLKKPLLLLLHICVGSGSTAWSRGTWHKLDWGGGTKGLLDRYKMMHRASTGQATAPPANYMSRDRGQIR